jgi:hypothetical protein
VFLFRYNFYTKTAVLLHINRNTINRYFNFSSERLFLKIASLRRLKRIKESLSWKKAILEQEE